jgi:hypothetical protein
MAGRLVLGLWAVGFAGVGALLMATHVVALPVPRSGDGRLQAAFANGPGVAAGKWTAVHVLYDSCGCSRRVFAHLTERRARPELIETIAYVSDGSDSEAQGERQAAETAGYRFEKVAPAELERRYRVESAPSLLVADAQGSVRYTGGYASRMGANRFDDLEILGALRVGKPVQARPVFGCAISGRLQQALDPLGVKYKGGPSR